MNDLLSYDPATGIIRWKVSRGTARAGNIAGTSHSNGYIRIMVLGKKYYAHRLGWYLHHEKWPTDEIDHINGVKTDNRICNLREATHPHNGCNRGKQANNTSGYKGASWAKGPSRWRADCRIAGKHHYLGLYDTPEAAHQAYCNFAAEHHQEFFHA